MRKFFCISYRIVLEIFPALAVAPVGAGFLLCYLLVHPISSPRFCQKSLTHPKGTVLYFFKSSDILNAPHTRGIFKMELMHFVNVFELPRLFLRLVLQS